MPHVLDPLLRALSPLDLFLCTLYGEARGETLEGQTAVACSIVNRVRDGRWGPTLSDVLRSWAQYSCLWPTLGGANYSSVLKFAQRISQPQTLSRVEKQLSWIMNGTLQESLIDLTANSTHYHTTSLPPPYWTKDAIRTGQWGRHYFYTNVK